MSGLSKSLRQAATRDTTNKQTSNLPPTDYTLVGEPAALDLAKTRFSSPHSGRQFLFYGQSGLGKTRLALELANWAIREHDYDHAVWINCQKFQIRGGRRLSFRNHADSLEQVIKEIAYFVKAEAVLKSSGKDVLPALNARCTGKSVLLVVDGIGGKSTEDTEAFLLAQPANFDVIATSTSDLGWRSSIELLPWKEDSAEAENFLKSVAHEQNWNLTDQQVRVALDVGRGVASGLIWSARLLHDGYSQDDVNDLSHDGWRTLLQHFFEMRFDNGIKSNSDKCAASLLSLCGNTPETEFNSILQGITLVNDERPSLQLVQAGFAKLDNGMIEVLPFALHFLKTRMSGSKRINSKVIDSWMLHLNARIEKSCSGSNWNSIFQTMDGLYPEAISALDAYLEADQEPSLDFVKLFESMAYFLYSRGYWDEFECYHERFLSSCLSLKIVDPLIEVTLVWHVRVVRHRGSQEAARKFFDNTVREITSNIRLTSTQEMRIQVARKSLENPHKFTKSLAIALADLSAIVEKAEDYEWSCRAMLHSGNVWAEESEFEKAGFAYKDICRIAELSIHATEAPWKDEMISLSSASLGVLANRHGDFKKGAVLLNQSAAKLVQTSDRATAIGEQALSLGKVGRRREARKMFSHCIDLKNQLGVGETVMESHPDWEIKEGIEELFSRKGFELLNPWWH